MTVFPEFLNAVPASASAAHGAHAAPPGPLGLVVVAVAVGVVALVFVLCAKYFLRPGETSPAHIKRRILE